MARRGGALEPYRARRSFKETPEPRGRLARGKGNAYLIQKHDATRLHYDFRLELDGVLKSWAVTRGPSFDPADKRLAVRTEDHPVDYGSFEGTIPEGHYGAGTVMLWDIGTWEALEDPRKGLKEGKLKFALHGKRLKGAWALVRMKPKKKESRENWLLIKDRDAAADRKGDITKDARNSIVSGRTMSAIAKGPTHPGQTAPKVDAGKRGGRLPGFVKPMLATLVDAVPEGNGWVHEVKFDGYRIQAALNGPDVRLYTRNGLDWTDRFGRLPRVLADLDLHGVLLDGEVAAVSKEGRTDFSALQEALGQDGRGVQFFVFDLLAEGGRSLRGKPLLERKKRLAGLLAGSPRNQRPGFLFRPCRGRRRGDARRTLRQGFRGHRRQAGAEHLSRRARQDLAEDQVRQDPGVRHRRMAPLGARPSLRLDPARPACRRHIGLCRTRRLRLRRRRARRSFAALQGAWA